jgi:hypothetical protein
VKCKLFHAPLNNVKSSFLFCDFFLLLAYPLLYMAVDQNIAPDGNALNARRKFTASTAIFLAKLGKSDEAYIFVR